MAVKKKAPPPPRPEFSRQELVIINNALNDICHGPAIDDDDEFQTRIGFSRAQAGKVLAKVARLLKK